MKQYKLLFAFASLFVMSAFCGCPDRSYMRPEPDWTKQSGGSTGEEDVDQGSESETPPDNQ